MKTTQLVKAAALAGVGGSMLMMDGCWFGGGGSGWWRQLLWQGAIGVATEFVLDNDSVFDLFQDDFGNGSTYDDRFTAEPVRVEPDEDAQAAADDVAPGRP